MIYQPDADGDATNSPQKSIEETTTPMRPRGLVVMHWLTVLLLCIGVTLILIRDEVDGRAMRMWLLEGHRHFGLFILLLFFARLALRLRLGKLPTEGNSSWLIRAAAASTHAALYAVLLAQPLLGWALSNAEGKPVHLFGATLPSLVGADEDLADQLTAWHLDIAWLLLGLVSLHVSAALWHHFVLRDGVLRRMLPKRRN